MIKVNQNEIEMKQKEIFKYFDLEDDLHFIFQEASGYFPWA